MKQQDVVVEFLNLIFGDKIWITGSICSIPRKLLGIKKEDKLLQHSTEEEY